jgi:exopolyphosphatase/guanosine-5'-triphosphate,3'-diphosphate pyrophosphatase
MILTREALDELVQRLASLPAAQRSSIPGIKPARADVILAGAVVLEGVLHVGGFDGLEVTEAGLREGVFFERLLAGEDPPLFEDVRRASVLNLASQYGADVPHTRHVAALALGMFDELAVLGLHAGDPHERELLWAACMLHDIGMSVDYDDHHKHSRYLILSAGLPGFSPAEVAVIAQAVRYHRKGLPEPGPLAALFGERDAALLDRCAVLLRLAEDLERARDQMVRRARFAVLVPAGGAAGPDSPSAAEARGGEIELRLSADGESAVPRWAASRETELFARAFHRELSVAA